MEAKSLKIWFPGNQRPSLYVQGLMAPEGQEGFTGTHIDSIRVVGAEVRITFITADKKYRWVEMFHGMPYRAEADRVNKDTNG